MIWLLWKHMNHIIFNEVSLEAREVLDSIKYQAWSRCKAYVKEFKLSLYIWCIYQLIYANSLVKLWCGLGCCQMPRTYLYCTMRRIIINFQVHFGHVTQMRGSVLLVTKPCYQYINTFFVVQEKKRLIALLIQGFLFVTLSDHFCCPYFDLFAGTNGAKD